MKAAFINDLVTGNCQNYISPRSDTGIYDSTKPNTIPVNTEVGEIEIPDGTPFLVGYLTSSGSICDHTGEVVALFDGYGNNKFELRDSSKRLLGAGNFQGLFKDSEGKSYSCPVLSNLANKAKKLIRSQKQAV